MGLVEIYHDNPTMDFLHAFHQAKKQETHQLTYMLFNLVKITESQDFIQNSRD